MPNTPRIPISKAFETPTDDESPEVEGHGRRLPYTEQPNTDERDSEAEVEGHMTRVRI